jgi:hypothetical protein
MKQVASSDSTSISKDGYRYFLRVGGFQITAPYCTHARALTGRRSCNATEYVLTRINILEMVYVIYKFHSHKCEI